MQVVRFEVERQVVLGLIVNVQDVNAVVRLQQRFRDDLGGSDLEAVVTLSGAVNRYHHLEKPIFSHATITFMRLEREPGQHQSVRAFRLTYAPSRTSKWIMRSRIEKYSHSSDACS